MTTRAWEADQLSEWLDFRSLTLEPEVNSRVHFTEKHAFLSFPPIISPACSYSWQNDRKLVVRRGFPVQIRLHGLLPFDPERNLIVFQFDLDGDWPRGNREAHRQVRVRSRRDLAANSRLAAGEWHAEVLRTRENLVVVQLSIPPTAVVGCWQLRVFSALIAPNGGTVEMNECAASKLQRVKLYVIFNPFHPDDDVHIDQRSTREYYLNQELDVWFSGTPIGSSKFNFRPRVFDESTMKTVVFLLDRLGAWHQQRFRGGLSFEDRRSVVRVARKLCLSLHYILFASHESGDVIEEELQGTAEIVDKFVRTRQPLHNSNPTVNANVFVSFLRALGICCRTITCVECVHDVEMPLIVDRAFVRSDDGVSFVPMKQNEDAEWEATWTFHLWVELFARRPDLPDGFGGWQVLDPTPQESTEGRFFYGQMNTDTVRWFYEHDEETNEFRLLKTDFETTKEKRVHEPGRALLTSNPRAFGFPMDVSADYRLGAKDAEDFRLHVATIKAAGLLERKERIRLLYGAGVEVQSADVFVWVHEIGSVLFGEDIHVHLELTNRASESHSVRLSVRIHTRRPNGCLASQINHFRERIELKPHETESLKLFTPIGDYAKHTTSRDFVAVVCAVVNETDQIFYREEKFELVGHSIAVVAPNAAEVGRPLVGLVVVRNPLGETLTDTRLQLQSGKLDPPIAIYRFPTEIAAGQRVKLQIRFVATAEGQRLLKATFTSKQMGATSALHFVHCTRKEHE
ncbi:Protein-glutamine gamma-glutamyltransferase K [Aphelenchoides fujianensis]|nr:Protein-glutamine gamma-glutamyltransferase K [Aphelenchoides fujianensis]